MNDTDGTLVPIWTLATTPETAIPGLLDEGALTPERLTELRAALAAFASAPLATLEARPLSAKRPRSAGMRLDGSSPLAKEIASLVERSRNVPAVSQIAESSEVHYVLRVPQKFADQFAKGLVKPMASKAADGGIYADLVAATGKKAIVGKATLVPVETAAAGAKGSAVGTVAGTAAAGSAMTVAAPLVLMAVAVGASAYADQERTRAIEHITELLEKLHDDKLEGERSSLDGCRDAIDKATALLLDRGKVGASLGLDSAVHAISTATQRAETRVAKWESALGSITDDNHVDVADLESAFPGITGDGGEFRAHLEIAALAVALKRRVIVLQGVEAGQSDHDNPFEHFVRSLREDQQRINDLETRIEDVLNRIANLELRSPKRILDKVMTRRQVDNLLETSYRLRALAPSAGVTSHATDVVIEIEKHDDGSLLVLPARAS